MAKAVVWLLCFLPCVLSQRDGEIRLLGSNLTFEGRVEIYHANKWGTICDDYWGKEEANVVCHQRNYTLGAQYWYSNAHFGEGKDPIWLDDVMCVGNETALTDCKHNGWKGHNCHHYEDVGVVCVKEEKYANPGTCDFEKGHGMCGYRKVVEKGNFNWTFGSRNIGYRRWPKTDHTTANLTGEGFYMTTFMNIWDDIKQGQVARIRSPPISSATCVEFFYFMGGSTVGELIVYLKTTTEQLAWQLIGDQGFKWKKGVIPIGSKYKNFNIIFEGVAGTGFYGGDVAIDDILVTSGTSCPLILPRVAKPSGPVTPKATVRLVGKLGSSMNKFAGRIEVFYNSGTGGRWGTVCDGGGYAKTFDIKAATVVCKELGYEGAEMVVPCCGVFGKGTGRIWMDNVKCVGTEPSITMCLHSGWGNTYCSHDYDVSVICKTNQTDRNAGFEVRLANDLGVKYKGRVEVNIAGIWGTVTDEDWDIYDANVACKQLHFGGAVGAYSGSNFGNGKGAIWMSNFNCNGKENSLAKCNHSNNQVQKTYGHFADAGVECFDLRLANGGSNMSGRVEIMYGGHWGTVCDHSWNMNAGNVVCRVLGYRRAEAVRSFGKGTGQIFLDKVRCQGDEPSLSFCRHFGWTANQDCTHDNDAGVVCTDATCSKSKPCVNGGTCNDAGLCNCAPSYVGENCQVAVGNVTVEVVIDCKLEQWNETIFKHNVAKDLNTYCTKVNCSAFSSKEQNTQVTFKDEDVQIVEPAKQQDSGLLLGFVVLYTDGITTKLMPRSFVLGFITNSGDKLAEYKVLKILGENEGAPAGRHSPPQDNSKTKYIYIGVGVTLGLIALLVLVFVVKRYGKRLVRDGSGGGGRAVPSSYSDQSYLALHADDYDESMDDTALLRPPQEPSGGDLIS